VALFKRAPDVRVFVPNTLFVGRPCVVEIVIESGEPLDVEYIDASIEGDQGWSVGSGKSRTTRRETYPYLTTRLRDAGTLAAGETLAALTPGAGPYR
jgi:hypothetical protein